MPHPRLLVVEDDRAIRELVAERLRAEGYTVEEAEDGLGAIRALETHRPPPLHYGAVLPDLMLPKASGLEVLARLRRELGDYVPVVAMSASSLALEVALDAGAVAAVAKPFDIEDLLSTFEHYCPLPG